jgi:hypothetical protein
MPRKFLFLLLLLVAVGIPSIALAQDEPNLDARQRLFPEVGAGLRAIRRGPESRYYVLLAQTKAVLVFDADGAKLPQVPTRATGPDAIVSGAALDVDAAGKVYVADRGGNAVKIYSPDGFLAASIPVNEPTGVAALPSGEIAVSSLSAGNLISVYDSQGKLLRKFGELADLADAADVNRHLNLGYLLSDAAGNLYYAFEYLPEPTVRKYDAAGILQNEFSITTLDFQGLSQAARREISKAQSGKAIFPHQIISAIALDSTTPEIWMALGDVLLRLSSTGDILAGMRTYSPSGARIVSQTILAEPERLLLGNDPLGIYTTILPHINTTPR